MQRVKDNLLFNMADGEAFNFDLFNVRKVKGRQVVNILDETKLGAYSEVKVTSTVDKRRLLADLKAGEVVDGAEIIISRSSLRIK